VTYRQLTILARIDELRTKADDETRQHLDDIAHDIEWAAQDDDMDVIVKVGKALGIELE
jgi:hypothetical protein